MFLIWCSYQTVFIKGENERTFYSYSKHSIELCVPFFQRKTLINDLLNFIFGHFSFIDVHFIYIYMYVYIM